MAECTVVQATNQHKPFFSILCVVLCGMHCERLLKRQGAENRYKSIRGGGI